MTVWFLSHKRNAQLLNTQIVSSNMEIRLADINDTEQVRLFFSKYLSTENDALYSDEFFCPDGVMAAIKRGQMIITIEDNKIIGAVRFYRKKKIQQISLYQFAIDSNFRGKDLLMEMLEKLRDTDIVVLCPRKSSFNEYYRRTGWMLLEPIN